MRALAATALTLAFLAMAAITYVAVTGDPMGGEPRYVLRIAPPEAAKSQPLAAPVPTTQPLAQPQADATPGVGALQPEPPQAAAAPAVVVEHRAATAADNAGEDVAGIVIGQP